MVTMYVFWRMVKRGLARLLPWLVILDTQILLKIFIRRVAFLLSYFSPQDGTNEQPGLAPRAIKEIFNEASMDHTHSLTFTMSMLEIYMGNLKDLLSARQSLKSYEASAKW